jgi:hypothetical protein
LATQYRGNCGFWFESRESADKLDDMIRRRHFDRAGTDAVALLRSLKPYHNGNAALRVIHDLDIRDKHQALIPNVIGVASPIIQLYGDDGTFDPRAIGNPTKRRRKLVIPPITARNLMFAAHMNDWRLELKSTNWLGYWIIQLRSESHELVDMLIQL